MTKEQVLRVVEQYRAYLPLNGVVAPQCADLDLPPSRLEATRHILLMCEQIEDIVEEDVEKAMRWLGFIQGVFWSSGTFSINEMREHNTKGEGDEGKRAG